MAVFLRGALILVVTTARFHAQAAVQSEIITKDVVIIGGGAGGGHAAVQLKDRGLDIALIEKTGRLGGCVNSYDDPLTNTTTDHGVLSYVDYANATSFMARLGVPITPFSQISTASLYADFTTGTVLTNYTPPNSSAMLAALQTYLALAEQYEDMLVPGYWNFPPPSSIPEDLLLPFGEFVAKYNLSAAVPLMFEATALGVGNLADELVMTVMQAFGGQMARLVLGTQDSFMPASRRVQDIYDAVADVLGEDVMYHTTVVSANRSDEGVLVTTRNALDNTTTTIRARKLLMGINPTLERMQPFDLDDEETAVFAKWQYSRLYVNMVRHPALSRALAPGTGDATSVVNLPASAQPANYLDTPAVPFQQELQNQNTSDGLFSAIVVGDEATSAQNARELVQGEFKRLVEGGVLDLTGTEGETAELEWVDFGDHGPMHMRVSAEEYRKGFVQELYGLQGRRSTWYTGGAYAAQFQTIIWAYNDVLIEKMLGS